MPKEPIDPTTDIVAFETGELSPDRVLDLFSNLVRTGLAWTLQGSYGRAAAALIEEGYLERGTGRILRQLNEVD